MEGWRQGTRDWFSLGEESSFGTSAKEKYLEKTLERKAEGIYTSDFSQLSGVQSLLKVKKYMGTFVGFKEDGKV